MLQNTLLSTNSTYFQKYEILYMTSYHSQKSDTLQILYKITLSYVHKLQKFMFTLKPQDISLCKRKYSEI